MTERTDYEKRLHAEELAFRRVIRALESVEPDVAQRIVRYLVDRYTPKGSTE